MGRQVVSQNTGVIVVLVYHKVLSLMSCLKKFQEPIYAFIDDISMVETDINYTRMYNVN